MIFTIASKKTEKSVLAYKGGCVEKNLLNELKIPAVNYSFMALLDGFTCRDIFRLLTLRFLKLYLEGPQHAGPHARGRRLFEGGAMKVGGTPEFGRDSFRFAR